MLYCYITYKQYTTVNKATTWQLKIKNSTQINLLFNSWQKSSYKKSKYTSIK